MNSDDTKMKSVVDLMWTVEEEFEPDETPQNNIKANCGGTSCCCCCSVPNFFTRWICT